MAVSKTHQFLTKKLILFLFKYMNTINMYIIK